MASARPKPIQFAVGISPAAVLAFFLLLVSSGAVAQVATVKVVTDPSGMRLQVDGEDFMVDGMNWDIFPRGTNYSYSIWNQPDDIIKEALDREMPLLNAMGVNAIRVYTGIKPRWVRYIYETYGIWTILNHSYGRYGVTLDGAYIANTDYADPKVRDLLVSEVEAMVDEFQDVPGVLMWLLGNENNYGLFWGGAETEDIPEGETLESVRARHMYKLFNVGIKAIKAKDSKRPVAICNGDLLFLDIIAEEVTDMDIFGTNMYRGMSFGDAFQRVKDELNAPILFTEFGSDVFNAKEMREDQMFQARYLISNWKEIYENASGKGLAGNSIGGMTFQFSDGWWKYGQEDNLDVHDTNASWANGGYQEDFVEGENNMNEEWFGICAKGPTDARGLYYLYPRAAYYALQDVHKLDVYDAATDLSAIRNYFKDIRPMTSMLKARGDKAALQTETLQKVRVSGLRMEFETFSTNGERVSTPENRVPGDETYPAFQGFDHLESFYATVEATPAPNVTGNVTVNVLGNVATNPIDEIFYENRGRVRRALGEDEPLELTSLERVKLYNASIAWDSRYFKLDGFYRTGHYHWGYEGDFFGLYPEANYGPNIDIYNGAAPLGFEMEGKKQFAGFKLAFGPELWWGANPAVLVKYGRKIGPFEATGMYQEDLDEQGQAVSSFAVPLPPNRKASLHVATERGPFGVEVGGLWSGNTKIDETFQIAEESGSTYRVLQDQVKPEDTFGGKIKLTYQKGRWNWYAQGAAMGLVADGGATLTQTFTGWRLKDSGSGNQWNALTGLAITMGNWQVAPNFMWQKPIVGPVPSDVPAPGRPRNILDDPFAVRANRETTAGEILLTYDPTPATWMYAWDSDVKEDARLAASMGFVFRHHPTTQDAAIGILTDGRTLFAFPGAPPARDLWEAYGRFVSKIRPGVGMIANLYGGEGEPNGNDDRLIKRYGGDVRLAMGSYKLSTAVKVNDWGPYDYHRDFNLTFPLQVMADVSNVLGTPGWFDLPQTSLGVRLTWRSLNEYSPRYCPEKVMDATGQMVCNPDALDAENGSEWEIRTYLHFNLGM